MSLGQEFGHLCRCPFQGCHPVTVKRACQWQLWLAKKRFVPRQVGSIFYLLWHWLDSSSSSSFHRETFQKLQRPPWLASSKRQKCDKKTPKSWAWTSIFYDPTPQSVAVSTKWYFFGVPTSSWEMQFQQSLHAVQWWSDLNVMTRQIGLSLSLHSTESRRSVIFNGLQSRGGGGKLERERERRVFILLITNSFEQQRQPQGQGWNLFFFNLCDSTEGKESLTLLSIFSLIEIESAMLNSHVEICSLRHSRADRVAKWWWSLDETPNCPHPNPFGVNVPLLPTAPYFSQIALDPSNPPTVILEHLSYIVRPDLHPFISFIRDLIIFLDDWHTQTWRAVNAILAYLWVQSRDPLLREMKPPNLIRSHQWCGDDDDHRYLQSSFSASTDRQDEVEGKEERQSRWFGCWALMKLLGIFWVIIGAISCPPTDNLFFALTQSVEDFHSLSSSSEWLTCLQVARHAKKVDSSLCRWRPPNAHI